MRMTALVCGAVLVATSVWAADVDGRWSGSLDTPNGAVTIEFVFKADGNSLSGSTTGPDGSRVEFNGGKIDGDNIAFTVNLDFGGMPFALAYTGVVSPDRIDLTADFMGMPFQFTVRKVAE
jgi:hypothetical protein